MIVKFIRDIAESRKPTIGGAKSFGFSVLEMVISLGIVGLAAEMSMSAFSKARDANVITMGKYESAMAVQRMFDFVFDPQLCKFSNISLDGIKYVYNGDWSTFYTMQSIRIGPTLNPEPGEPLITVGDHGSYGIKSIKLVSVFPIYSRPSSFTNSRYALGGILIEISSKYSTKTKVFDLGMYMAVDTADKIIDCHLITDARQVCEDLGWKFDKEKSPSCSPT